jgi:GT2 family glycosyltransferase
LKQIARSMTTICAIVPTFNRSALLAECLDSLLAQTRTLDRIVVVNDGSTDDTPETLRRYGNRLTVIDQPNAGKATALNAALSVCDSDYVWICDDDDIADERGAELLGRALDDDDKLDFVFGTFRIFSDGETGRSFRPPSFWARDAEENTLINVLEESFTFQFAQLVRRSTFARVGGFRQDLVRSQDYEMFIRLARSGRSAYVPEVIFYQRQHAGARGSAADGFAASSAQVKWLFYDQIIFRELRLSLQLEEVIPTFARQLEEMTQRRAALVQRACIFAQRALWSFALEDLAEACQLGADNEPLSEEIDLAGAVVRSGLSWSALAENHIERSKLRHCVSRGRYGRAIVLALTRPLVWQARHAIQGGDFTRGLAGIKLLVETLGMSGAATRIFRSVLR